VSTEQFHEAAVKLTDMAGDYHPAFAEMLDLVRRLRKECADIRQQWQQHYNEAPHEPEENPQCQSAKTFARSAT
jgi:hypothetical protein